MSEGDAAARESLARLRNAGRQELAGLFDEHRQRLRRMVDIRLDRRVAARIDPSDVLQEVFIDAMKQLERYVEAPPFSPFLWLRFLTGQRLMILHRTHLGTQKRDAKREVSFHGASVPAADSMCLSGLFVGRLTSPSQAAAKREQQARLQEALDRMDPIDREILALRHFEELTNAETAEELEISVQAASKRYVRALTRLQKVLGGTSD